MYDHDRVCWVPVYRLDDGRVVRPGPLYRRRNGRWAEPVPVTCPNGHTFRPRRMLVGWVACSRGGEGGGHRTTICLECEAVVYTPPMTERCEHPTTRST